MSAAYLKTASTAWGKVSLSSSQQNFTNFQIQLATEKKLFREAGGRTSWKKNTIVVRRLPEELIFSYSLWKEENIIDWKLTGKKKNKIHSF